MVKSHQPEGMKGIEKWGHEPLTTLMRDFPIPVYITQNNVLRFVNPALQTMTGYSEDELLGKNILDIISHEDRQLIPAGAAKNTKARNAIKREISILCRNGEARKLLETVIPVLYEGSQALLGTFIVPPEDKSLEKRLARLNQILNVGQNINQLVALETNSDWLIKSACQIFASSQGFRNAWIALLDDSRELKSAAEGGLGDEFHSLLSQLMQGKLPSCASRALAHSSNVVIINDVAQDCADCPFTGHVCGHTAICVRLGYQEKTYGVLSATLAEGTRLGQDEQALFREVAQNIAAALSNIELGEKRRQDELQMERAHILDLANDAFFVHDLGGNFKYVNDMACKMTGYARDELLRMNLRETVVRDPNAGSFADRIKTISEEGEAIFESTRRRKDGSVVPVEVHSSPIELAGESLHYDIVRDITERKIIMEALRQSQEHYKTLFNSLSDAVFIHDLQGRFLEVNEITCERFGYQKEDMLKLAIANIVAPERFISLSKLTEQLKEKNSQVFETELVTRNGKVIPHEVSTRLVEYERQQAILTMARDITERKQADKALGESEKRYRTLFESAAEGILIADIETKKFKYSNPAICTMLGYSQEELTKMSVGDIHPKTSLEHVIAEFAALAKGEKIFSLALPCLKKDGTIIYADINGAEAIIDGRECNIGFFTDITERKTMERELEKKVDELEKANEQLRELDRLKDNFLSTVSHELRTPLTSIKSFAEILLNYEEDRDTQREFLGIINDESERLTRLINDFLDLSKIQAGRMQWQTAEVSLTAIIEAAINITRPVMERERLSLTVDIEPDLPLVLSDRDRLQQVFTNLLGNAIKFTPESGRVGVKAWLSKGDGTPDWPDMVTVSISDSGIGIAPENHEKIFEKFGQVGDVLKDRPKGSGLGLPISKKIIENYGGRIWVESALGKGSTFFLTVPVAIERVSPLPSTPELELKAPVSAGKTVLVVDDEANIRRIIRHELERYGHKIIEAGGGAEAVELAKKHIPDLITLDINMPDLDGFDVTAVLKNNSDTKKIPILIVSVVEDRQKAYQLGANDYITKPIVIDTLLERVNRLLQGAQKNILVVDDDMSLVKSLRFELNKYGFAIDVAYNGDQAIKAVARRLPDLILLDIKMPKIDGYEVIKVLKDKPEARNIPIIIMTGVEIDGGRVTALSLGVVEYVQKSEGFSRLFEAIEKILAVKAKV